jgi:hypothetical protein
MWFSKQVKKFSVSYETRKFIVLITQPRYMSHLQPDKFITLHHGLFNIFLILYSQPYLAIQIVSTL